MTISVEDNSGVVRVLLGDISSGADDSDFGLKVVASDGSTVIIDGTSDIFKITATGTLTTSGAGTGTAQSSVTLNTGQTTIPACFIWTEFLDTATTQNAGELAPTIVPTAAGLIAFMYEGWAELTAVSGEVKIVVQTTATTAGAGGRAGTYRYYLMTESAF